MGITTVCVVSGFRNARGEVIPHRGDGYDEGRLESQGVSTVLVGADVASKPQLPVKLRQRSSQLYVI